MVVAQSGLAPHQERPVKSNFRLSVSPCKRESEAQKRKQVKSGSKATSAWISKTKSAVQLAPPHLLSVQTLAAFYPPLMRHSARCWWRTSISKTDISLLRIYFNVSLVFDHLVTSPALTSYLNRYHRHISKFERRVDDSSEWRRITRNCRIDCRSLNVNWRWVC